jgi:hypothetical protein
VIWAENSVRHNQSHRNFLLDTPNPLAMSKRGAASAECDVTGVDSAPATRVATEAASECTNAGTTPTDNGNATLAADEQAEAELAAVTRWHDARAEDERDGVIVFAMALGAARAVGLLVQRDVAWRDKLPRGNRFMSIVAAMCMSAECKAALSREPLPSVDTDYTGVLRHLMPPDDAPPRPESLTRAFDCALDESNGAHVIRALCDAGFRPPCINDHLVDACTRGRIDAIAALLAMGADPSTAIASLLMAGTKITGDVCALLQASQGLAARAAPTPHRTDA